jgi:AAA15 family ATPase/GTPase
MIDSLHIQNYRLFKDLKIDKLGQVNLIAGKNNTGKTALLEALRIYLNNFNSDIILNVLSLRESINLTKIYDSVTNLFNEIENPIFINNRGLSVKKKENSGAINIFRPTKEGRRTVTMETESIDFPNLSPHDETVFIPFNHNENLKIQTDFWEKIEFEDDKVNKVAEFLNIISSKKIRRVSLNSGTPRIQFENGEIEKLTMWGDGATRLLTITLALINAKDKTLLIDEFEVGLHHSVQEQLWEIIFKYAKEWNIQVFVTTHGRDTVEAFHNVSTKEEYKDMGQYMRLQKSSQSDDIEAVIYTEKSLDTAFDLNLETR